MQSLEERPLGDDRTATAPVDRDGAPPASIAGGDGDVGDERSGRERALVAVVVVVAAAALAALTVARLRGAVSLFLSPDGAHYLADADALLGHGVRAIAHPPAFPALVAATERTRGVRRRVRRSTSPTRRP